MCLTSTFFVVLFKHKVGIYGEQVKVFRLISDRADSDSQGSSLPEILNKTRTGLLVLDFFRFVFYLFTF